MRAQHAMAPCYDEDPQASDPGLHTVTSTPRVVELLSNHDASKFWFTETGDLRPGPEGDALTAALGFSPTLTDWRQLATRAIFAVPGEMVTAAVDKAKSATGWGRVRTSGLSRVGVHARLFVDVSTRHTRRVSSAFWACTAAAIRAADAANPAPPGSPPLLIYFATDMLKSRKDAVRELGGLGRVVFAPGMRVGHTAGNEAQSLPGLIDWYMLAETDVVVGTVGSTFAATAAGLQGVLGVLAGEEASLEAAAAHWLELLVAQLTHVYPAATPQAQLRQLLQRCLEQHAPPPNSSDRSEFLDVAAAALEACSELDVQAVMRVCSSYCSDWFMAHAPALMAAHPAGARVRGRAGESGSVEWGGVWCVLNN